MWESFISWYINSYLGRYIENLNAQQLSFALRQGELELENVPLKKNIFRSWGLPIEVRSGVVGRIKIEFNLLKYLRNEPVVITIEDIYLVAGALNLAEWDPMVEEALAHETKMSSLDAHEGRWKAQYDLASNSSSYYSSLYFSSMQIGASIVTKVVENLQLNVRTVHIRFEEEIGSRSRVIAFGVTLESLTAQSCDSSWNPLSSSSVGATDCSFKTLQLNKFGVYCDTKGERFSNIPPQELKEAMRKILSHDYLLCPVSAEARISKNNTPHPLSSNSRPRFDVQLTLDKVPLQMTDSQYRNSFRGYKSFLRLHRNCKLRHYRPFITSVHDGPLEWWKYAARAILAVRGYKTRTVLRTWEEVLSRAKDNVAYVAAYELHLARELLSSEMQKLKDQMEIELHYEEIVALREVAMRRVELRNEKHCAPAASVSVQSKAQKSDSSDKPGNVPTDAQATTGIFSYIFPSWTSWISSSATTDPNADTSVSGEIDAIGLSAARSQEEIENEKIQLRKSESELDEAILDDVKSFGRDTLLAKFKFVLKQGMVTLNRKNVPFLELDFCGVEIQTEIRPKSGSHKIRMTLASLFLRDCPTKSLLVAPHSHTNLSFPSAKLGVLRKSNSGKNIVEPIFNLFYERKPNKRTGHRISVTMKPLDLVVYPVLWEDIGNYFACDEAEDYLEVPHNGYEAMKQKTKEELRTYWERLINLRNNSNLDGQTHSNWEVHFDISAPQIVIRGTKLGSENKATSDPKPKTKFISFDSKTLPSSGADQERFVVIDLGRFRFTNKVDEYGEPCNVSFGSADKSDTYNPLAENLAEEEEEEDEFMTPCSSPVGERANADGVSSEASSPRPSLPDLSEVAGAKHENSGDGVFDVSSDSLGDLQAKLYKKYRLEITDIQVIVVEGKACRDGSWRTANSRCTSLLHLIDRFSINLQLERRLIYSEDPLWPALTLVATLPKLNLHFNESKVLAVQGVMNSFMSPKSADNSEANMKQEKLNSSVLSGSQLNLHDVTSSDLNNLAGGDKSDKSVGQNPDKLSNCKLYVAQFTIQQVSVDIQSRGRSIAELQIIGARTILNKRTSDTSISFVIHSLLLADAVQTFGPDFELLLASHKHVSMDSVSGSLRDSDPTSPMSPQSPSSPHPFAQPKVASNQLAIPSQLHDALLTSLQGKRTKSVPSSLGVESPVGEEDALISAELVLLNSEEENLAMLSVQFNNLDVIANQETILEIFQFIQHMTPKSKEPVVKEPKARTISRAEGSSIPLLPSQGDSWKVEASFDFNRLNVLLLRGVMGKDGNQGARKIATATACDARVSFSMCGSTMKVEGSLGGLQMLNLTPEGQYHQRILSVGKDPLIDSAYNVFNPSGKYTHAANAFPASAVESALGFTYENSPSENFGSPPLLKLRMASVIYTHCPVFLIDLKKCIDQFQAPLAFKLKSAAAHIALGLVRQDTVHGLYRSPTSSLSNSLDKLNVEDETISGDGNGMQLSSGIRLDVILDSPVVVLPRNRTSSEVLVANLGQITVVGNTRRSSISLPSFTSSPTSEYPEENKDTFTENQDDATNYSVLICDMSLYSLDLKERWSMIDNLKLTYPTSTRMALMRARELYFCDPSMAKPILHNTVIQFNINYFEESFLNAEYNLGDVEDTEIEDEYLGPKLEIHGRVVNPLKVSLTPEQYSQVLDSLNNVAAGEDDFIQSELKVNIMERRLNWEKEVSSFSRATRNVPDPMPLPSPTMAEDDSLPMSATFQVPELILELVLPEESASPRPEIPHLSLSCSDLSLSWDKKGHVAEMVVCLKTLTLEDTSAPSESNHRVLAISKTDTSIDSADVTGSSLVSSVFNRSESLSASCPNFLELTKSSPVDIRASGSSTYFTSTAFARTESSSLPDHLDPSDIISGRFFQGMTQRSAGRKRRRQISGKRPSVKTVYSGSDLCPVTPPPSPRPFESTDNLVQIKMNFIDPKSPNFLSKYKGTHKFTHVDFNTLDVLLTPNTFICLRRFFSDVARIDERSNTSSAKINESQRKEASSQQFWPKTKINVQVPSPEKGGFQSMDDKDKNSEIQINVKALRLQFGEQSGTLAEAEVVDVTCHLVNRGKAFFGVDGRLGALQIRDVSRYAGKYPTKFIFQGKQALDFDYCRRNDDANFRLEMASVLYVHTHRFYTEFYALLISLFGSSALEAAREEAESEPVAGSEQGQNSARICLNIQAGAPVLFFPYSSSSTSLLVTDLGHLSVRNKFIEDPLAGVFDIVSLDLMEMDLYSAELKQSASASKADLHGPKSWTLNKHCIVVKTSNRSSLLNSKCALNLKVKRSLSGISSPTQAGMSVQGTLSTVYATLDPEKYQLIRGLLQYNIGEKVEINSPIPTPQRKRRQSIDGAKGPVPVNAVPSSKLDLEIGLDLVNVTVEVVKDDGSKLSRIDFVKSRFTFHNYSDGTRDVDLASQEILICDVRFIPSGGDDSNSAKNVFTNILQQTSGNSLISVVKRADGSSTPATKLQAEVHFRTTLRGSNVTILLNNMRLMLIMDWWMEVQSFLSQNVPEPPQLEWDPQIEEPLDSMATGIRTVSPLINRSKQLMSPVTVAAGIVTKRAPVLDIPPTTFELKMNVSDCELVVVEDPSVWDSNAVILKVTAALSYRPHLERPISCNILTCELFSCILGLESDTALSILDPTTATLELVRKTKSEPQGILDATISPSSMEKVLRVQSPQLSLRLSYYDMKMFVQLMERFSKQAKAQLQSLDTGRTSIDLSLFDGDEDDGFPKGVYQRNYHFEQENLDHLLAMGFERAESLEVLEICDGRVEEAAIMLTSSNSSLDEQRLRRRESNESRQSSIAGPAAGSLKTSTAEIQDQASAGIGAICGLDIKVHSLSVCIIDDCRDADVPLVELNINQLEFSQDYVERCGKAECTLSGDYYNRELCGWEPFLEAWKSHIHWKQNERGQLGNFSPTSEFPTKAPELELSVSSGQVMNINITSTLLNLSHTVSANWSEAYNHQDKRRTPFVPFILKNETGSTLWFTTILSNSNEEVLKQQKQGTPRPDGTSWIQVQNGSTQTFSFEGRGKLRHRNTHQLRTHQLAVRVMGWQDSNPVSVDRVGTYFRVVKPVTNEPRHHPAQITELPTTRLVFEVTLQGSAQKLVRVRSALMVKNSLPEMMELKLENTIVYPAFEMAQTGGSYTIQVKPDHSYPIPLHSVCAQIWIRPVQGGRLTHPSLYSYCTKPLLLSTNSEGLRYCSSFASNQVQPYRFCVAIKRDEFPADTDEPNPSYSNPSQLLAIGMTKRANLITLLSPLTLVNLLPYEIAFEIKETGINGRILPGKKCSVTNVDTLDILDILFVTENFPQGGTIGVSTSSAPCVTRLKLLDTQKRPLYLTARVKRGDGGTITVLLSSQYWIVNKSGLPILVKQEGTYGEAAGQFHEHEVCRMVAPLLFSFPDTDTAANMALRVGFGLHSAPARPHWCKSFGIQNGTRVRKLTVALSHSQPEVVYLVGVEVKDGKGRYRDSKLITIAPRFVIDNRSSRRMQISQRNFATSFLDPAAEATHSTLTPGCSLPFHWPRLDKDQLLCVRLLNVKGSVWSGGFPIETVDSFHLNVRDFEGNCYFLRVEIVVEGPTYFVVFSDTDQLPPPFRVDNLSLVPIIFHQTNVGDERLKLVAKPESSCPYAWDEPTQPSNLTVAAPGGTSAIANMNNLGLVAHITYENFFYIALTATFPKEGVNGGLGVSGIETLQLVLDVPEGTKVALRKKEPGNRTQLWRVNADGLIEHEGSSSPRDPRKPVPPGSHLVLDISGQASQPTQWVHLMLRKPDRRRASTQHWEFTRDGRLKCATLANMFVQAKDGFGIVSGVNVNQGAGQSNVAAWQMWSEVVLGPPQSICYTRTDSGIPAEQAIARQKLRAGSGRLTVTVDTDGPTRVLRIVDTERLPRSLMLHHTFEENSLNTIPKMLLTVDLHAGVGISLINCKPREELVYARFSAVKVKWLNSKESETLEASVQDLQIDNQLLEAEKPVVIYVAQSSRYDADDPVSTLPAMQLSWKRLKSKLNAHVYKTWELTVKPLSAILEERLLLKLCVWGGYNQSMVAMDDLHETDFEVQKPLTNSTSLTTKRFYFGTLRIVLNQVRLSVLTSSKLSPDLAAVKRRLGLTLIRFEEALVDLDPFFKQHPFETFDFLLASLVSHYRDELLSQALLVLGSVDFLGNPVGFVNDVSVGVSGLIHEGSVGALVKNVTHGLSNSAAKVTGSLGDGLTRTFTMDMKHEDERRKIREEHSGSSGEQFTGGLRGLGHGVFGGLTSIITQTYDGVVNDGFTGLVSGLGKGIVGTVTKPAVGVLDFASGAASALRDSSRSSSRMVPKRNRLTRLVTGNGGLLPPYSEQAARGQDLLYELNDRDYNELFIGCDTVKSGPPDLKILVSSEYVVVFRTAKGHNIMLQIPLRELLECRFLEIAERGPMAYSPTAPYEKKLVIEFVRQQPGTNIGLTRPQVIVDNEQVAKKVVQQVNYARILYEEMRHSQINRPTSPTED